MGEITGWRRPAQIWDQGEPFLFKGDFAPSDVIQVCLSPSLSLPPSLPPLSREGGVG